MMEVFEVMVENIRRAPSTYKYTSLVLGSPSHTGPLMTLMAGSIIREIASLTDVFPFVLIHRGLTALKGMKVLMVHLDLL